MPLFVIIDERIGVCGLAGTNHGVCTDANTTLSAKRRWCGADSIAGRGYSTYVTIKPACVCGFQCPNQAPYTCNHLFFGVPHWRFDIMRLVTERLRVTWRMAMAYAFAAAGIKAMVRICDADHCKILCRCL